MTTRSWIRKLFARPVTRTLRKAPARRPAIEALEDRLTPAYPAITPLTGAANPFRGIDVGVEAKPALGDVDGDGDRDALVGESDGTLRYFRNTGTAAIPVYTPLTGGANPFNGIDVGFYSAPALGDVDGDGDRDALVGAADGTLRYFRNLGTATSPFYVQQTGAANPWGGLDVGDYAGPALGDVDGDGDLDTLVGALDGTLRYLRNTGTATSPVYVEQTGAANPWGGVDVGFEAKPALGDVDGDGDRDALVGEANGTLVYFKNTGTATSPVYAQQTGAANPFNGFDVGTYSAPALGGVDGDGDLDVIVGAQDGTLKYFRNDAVPPAVNAYELTGAANLFNGVDVGLNAAPALGDVDGDGDLDAVVGMGTTFVDPEDGQFRYYKNTGTAASPVYVQQTGAANPFNGIDVGFYSQPALGDMDGDGDLDLLVGAQRNGAFYFKNTGTAVNPVYVPQTGAANPWGVIGAWHAAPALADVDGDGDRDVLVGEDAGRLFFFRTNRTPFVVNAIPDQTFSGPGVHSYAVPPDTFLDLDTNTLTYSATLVGGGALPAWLTFNPATRTFSGNPAPGDASPVQLRVTAADGNGGSGFDDFQLTLVNIGDNRVTQTAFVSSLNPSTYGQAVTFTATVTSSGTPLTQGTVTFREGATVLAGPLSINAGGQASFTIATLGAGSRTLTAQYSGHGDFASSSGNFGQTVNRAPLVIQADDKTKVAGQAVPPLTATYSGFVLGQGPAHLTTPPTLATSDSNAAGTYPITVSGASSPNYLIAYLNGTLTVRPGAVTYYYIYPGSELATSVQVNVPLDIYILPFDVYFNWITDYAGTISFYTPDPLGAAPADYTFTGTEGGIGVPGPVTFGTPGTQELYVWDAATVSVFGYAAYTVVAGAGPGGGEAVVPLLQFPEGAAPRVRAASVPPAEDLLIAGVAPDDFNPATRGALTVLSNYGGAGGSGPNTVLGGADIDFFFLDPLTDTHDRIAGELLVPIA